MCGLQISLFLGFFLGKNGKERILHRDEKLHKLRKKKPPQRGHKEFSPYGHA